MRLPKSWNDITIHQFQECYFILKNKSYESWLQVIAILSGITYAEVEAMPIKKLKPKIYQLQFLLDPKLNTKVKRFIYLNGKIYKSVYLPNELSASQLKNLNTAQAIDIKTFAGDDPSISYMDNIVENAHKLLASIYMPLTWKGFKYCPEDHGKLSDHFKNAKMGDVYGTLFFYSNVFQKLTDCTADFFENNQKTLNELMTEVNEWAKDSEATGVGK